MVETQELNGVHLHIKLPSVRKSWDKLRAFSEWMLDENIFPVRLVGGVRAADEFSGMFLTEDWAKVEPKLKELGIKDG